MPRELSLFKRHLKEYRENAKRRKIEWALSETQFLMFITRACYYCGAPPKKLERVVRGVVRSSREQFNGIDRRDSSLGYFLENCVPACKDCNRGKGELTPRKFLSLARRISRKHK